MKRKNTSWNSHFSHFANERLSCNSHESFLQQPRNFWALQGREKKCGNNYKRSAFFPRIESRSCGQQTTDYLVRVGVHCTNTIEADFPHFLYPLLVLPFSLFQSCKTFSFPPLLQVFFVVKIRFCITKMLTFDNLRQFEARRAFYVRKHESILNLLFNTSSKSIMDNMEKRLYILSRCETMEVEWVIRNCMGKREIEK